MCWKQVAFIPLAVVVGCSPQNASAPARTAAADSALARPADTSGFAIVKLDPALDAIVSPDAALETVGDRFGLTEGPVWVQTRRGRLSAVQ